MNPEARNPFEKATVLFLDDVEGLRKLAATYLERSGYRVITAEDGHRGLELFRRYQPDIVLTDLAMKPVGGLEVLEAVRNESSKTPVIILTGYENFEDAKHALRLGAYDFLSKKDALNNHNLLVASVKRAEEKVRLERENSRYQNNLEKQVQVRTSELEKQTRELQSRTEELEKRTRELVELRDLSEKEREVSERLKMTALESMQYNEKKYRALISKSPIGIATIGNQSKITSVNASFVQVLGYGSKHDLMNKLFFEVPGFDSADIRQLIIECLDKQQDRYIKGGYTGPDKKERFLECMLTPIKIDEGIDYEILITVKDATLEEIEARRLKAQAERDGLTGLLNQEKFKEKLGERMLEFNRQPDSQIAVAHLDLDNFRDINTIYGHQVASELLRIVGFRINACLHHDKDLGFRVGGDEFAIIFTGYKTGSLEKIFGRMFNHLSEPYVVEEDGKSFTISITFSAGVTTCSGKQQKSIDRIYKEADDATYYAKDNGKNCFVFYDSTGQVAPARHSLQ